MTQYIAPDGAGPSLVQPTHYHCYRYSAAGGEWDRAMRTDAIDQSSPDRPPIRVCDWLIKSRRLIDAVHVRPEYACDWLIAEWDDACGKAMYAVPEWVDSGARAKDALHGIRTGCWPHWSQWIRGGTIVLIAVVGTDKSCH